MGGVVAKERAAKGEPSKVLDGWAMVREKQTPPFSRLRGFFRIMICCLEVPLTILRGCLYGRKLERNEEGVDILFISQYHWEQVWRRNQHVAKHLSRNRKIFYLTPFPIHLLTVPQSQSFHVNGDWVSDRIYVLSTPVFVGESWFPFIVWINRMVMRGVLAKELRVTGISPGLLWFSHPYAESLVEQWPGYPVVYDVQDEYPSVPTAPKNVAEREMRLLKKADIVFTGTFSLYLKKRAYSRNIHFVACGVDFDHFHRVCDESLEIPADIGAIRAEKMLGYFGAVGDRIDWGVLREIALRHPEWAIVLIGGVSRIDPEVGDLKNIHILGKRSYSDLPRYIKRFDVCLIPFKIDDLTRYIYPTKLLEYLSAGKPVISSPIPDVERFFTGVVGIAGDIESFEREMAKLEDWSERIEKGMEMARKSSWEDAIGEMEKRLNETLSRR